MAGVNNGPFIEQTLPNGLRVVIERMEGVGSGAAGFLVRTGARHERREQAGVSHFLEHMCFKGTPRRTWQEITVAFDTLGSYYNAFTSKERTFYFGWVPTVALDDQIELLADMMRATLPEDEFLNERGVILEEIAMSEDQIQHVAYDFTHKKIFGDHPLSWPVLGYHDVIEKLDRRAMVDYFRARYAPNNMVLIVAGNVDPDAVFRAAERCCGSWESADDYGAVSAPAFEPGASCQALDRFKQQLVIAAFAAPGSAHEDRECARAVAAILGGDNSRFYWNIMQAGLSPSAGAWYVDYADSGLLLLSAQAEPENCEKILEAIRREADRIHAHPVEGREIRRVKNKRRTSLAVEAESPYHRLVQLMDDIDVYGSPRTVEQRLAAVDAITEETIAAYLKRWPINQAGHLIGVGPRHWPETQTQTQS